MSRNYSANLGYGIKINDDKLYQKIINDDFDIDGDLKIIHSGSYDDESVDVFVCIKNSLAKSCLYCESKSIKQSKLIAPTDWHDRLVSWANENDCSESQIGWWLTVQED